MKGWPIVVVGAIVFLGGVFLVPGMPGCKYCGQVYTSTFTQNLALPVLAMTLGVVILLVGSYMMGQDSQRHQA